MITFFAVAITILLIRDDEHYVAVATAGWPAPKGRRTDHHALYRCLLSGSQVGNQFVIEPLTDPLDSMWTTLE